MSYPYQGRDLFHEPEGYSYAQCDNESYLEDWQQYRQETVTKLKNRATASVESPEIDDPHGREISGTMDLKNYLRKIRDDLQNDAGQLEDIKANLSQFAVKYEVFKRLNSHYDHNIRKNEISKPASLDTYLIFSQCLGLAAAKLPALNLLSTCLKLNDALSSIPPERFTPDQAELMISIIRLEDKLVQNLAAGR